jgi:hypothetical protein
MSSTIASNPNVRNLDESTGQTDVEHEIVARESVSTNVALGSRVGQLDEHGRIDLEGDFGNAVDGESRASGMFPDRLGAGGVVLAIDLAVDFGDIAADPPDVRHTGKGDGGSPARREERLAGEPWY